MSTLEEIVTTIHRNVFLREFSFSRNQFRPAPDKELEFADQVIMLSNILMVFQLKEKTGPGDDDRWFEKKVLGLGTKQIRDTLGYLKQFETLTLTNNRGHVFTINGRELVPQVKCIVYHSSERSPLMLKTRHHVSRTAGIIHIISAYEYQKICELLFTPGEILEYFEFRERIVSRYGGNLPSEKALVGQYLAGDPKVPPFEEFASFVDRFRDRREEWDISHVTQRFGDRITTQLSGFDNQPGPETQYYRVLSELALLIRPELAAFRERFEICLAAAREHEFHVPLRMITKSGCGFLFLAIPPEKAEGRLRGLENLTAGSKYEQKLERHVGVVICMDGSEVLIDWIYLEFPWKHDHALEDMLKNNNPFLPLRNKWMRRYEIDE